MDAKGQNITIMNRGGLTVWGQGVATNGAAVTTKSLIIAGRNTYLDITNGQLSAETVHLSSGASLTVAGDLKHVSNTTDLTLTLSNGVSMENVGPQSAVLNKSGDTNIIVQMKDDPNYLVGNWTISLNTPLQLDFSYFTNATMGAPIVQMNGILRLNSAATSKFGIRADGITYDTMELFAVGDRGKICLQSDSAPLKNGTDYLKNFGHLYYTFFYEDPDGTTANINNDGVPVMGEWRTIDLITKTKVVVPDGKEYKISNFQAATWGAGEDFSSYTGLSENTAFHLLFENNTLSLIISPDHPTSTIGYYHWLGDNQNLWTRNNSAVNSPWSEGDIYLDGHRVVFGDVDAKGVCVTNYSVELDSHVATGHLGDGGTAGIEFSNRGPSIYIIKSDDYHGTGYIADLSETDLTTVTIDGGRAAFRTRNTYGGALSSEKGNPTTIIKGAMVGKDLEYFSGTKDLSAMDKQQALDEDMVSVARYVYGYRDSDGSLHAITQEEYNAGTFYDKHPEEIAIIQTKEGDWYAAGATFMFRSNPTEMTEAQSAEDSGYVEVNPAVHYGYVQTKNGVTKFVTEGAFRSDLTNSRRVELTQVSENRWEYEGLYLDMTEDYAKANFYMTEQEETRTAYAYRRLDDTLAFVTKTDYENHLLYPNARNAQMDADGNVVLEDGNTYNVYTALGLTAGEAAAQGYAVSDYYQGNDYTYAYYYMGEDNQPRFITLSQFQAGHASEVQLTWNGTAWEASVSTDVLKLTEAQKAAIGDKLITPRGNYYTYVAHVEGSTECVFLTEAEFDQALKDKAAGTAWEGYHVARAYVTESGEGWYISGPDFGKYVSRDDVAADDHLIIYEGALSGNYFGYGVYTVDENGTPTLHFVTQDEYISNRYSTADDTHQAIIIRLNHNEQEGWYTPGELLAEDSYALGTSEVEIGFGGTLLATKDLHLISVNLKSGSRLETYGNLYIGKEFDVTSGARVTIGGLLDAADVCIKTGGMLTSHDVSSRKIVVENGAVWHMNDDRTSTIDVSDYVELHGGSRITGVALITNGDLLLQPDHGDYAVLDGTIKIGTNASLNLSHLQPENADGHYRSNLYITDRGGLLLEPHDGIVLTPSEVNHLLDDHGDTPHAEHYMHLATMEEGARFGIESSTGDITILNPALARANDPVYASSVQVFLASGLGYMVDATVSMRPMAGEGNEGLNEVVLHLTNKTDAPAYVWDGTYSGNWNSAANDNIWTMDQGETTAWSDNAVFAADSASAGGRSAVYFLETARTTVDGEVSYHYVNPDGAGVFNRAKYVNVQGDVWCDSITVDVDRLYDMTLDQYRFNLGYLFYSVDTETGKQGDGAITDYYVHNTDGTAISSKAYDQLSAEQKAAYGERRRTSITKNGTGVLTLATDNDFSGDVNLNSDTIFITSETGLGTSHVYMNDGTSLNVNYIFENKGSSSYRNPYLYNEITINDGVPLGDDELGNIGGGKGSNVTIGYNPVSVLDFMKSTGMQGLPADKDAITSRHWRTLTIMGALHGGEQTTLTLQGYTSSDSRELWVSMFHICGSEGETDFSGTIKLANYRNTSPAAYNFGTQEDLQNDTNTRRGTGPVQLTISDGTLRYARLDLTREDVLASYTKDDGSKGYGRRQTPTNTLLLEGSSAIAGLDADFLGTVATDPEHGAVTVATQGEELTSVRAIATGDYTLTLEGVSHDVEGTPEKTYVFSGVLGGNYAYATPGDGTFKKGYEDKEDTRRSQGNISLVHVGDGAQYIHTAYVQDLSIGNEKGGAYTEASGGTLGFHYLDLQGNLSLYSGARLELGVNDATRTSDAHNGAAGTAVHWDNSAYVSDNVTLQGDRRAIIHTTLSQTSTIPVSAPVGSNQNGESGFTTNWVMAEREVPLGSVIDGSLTINHGSHLDFNSSIMPVKLAGYDTAEKATWLTQLQFPVVEKGSQSDYSILCAPETSYLLDITGELVLKGQVHVDFKGVDFSAEDNGSTYFLARAKQGIVGSVNEQTISLGNGYYGVVRGLQTYTTDVKSITLDAAGQGPTTLTAVTAGTDPEPGVTGLAALADIQVTVKPAVGSTDYYLEYTWTDRDNVVHEDTVTLVQASNNVYSYTIGDNSYDAVLTTDLTTGAKMARMNLSDLAFSPEEGYIIMTVTNTPPRVWFNTNNVMIPVESVIARDDKGEPLVVDGRPVFMTPEGIYFITDPSPAPDEPSFTYDRYGHTYTIEYFGATDNDNVWHADGPMRKGWIDNHEDFWVGCRVTFNKYGSTHYIAGDDIFTRGTNTFTLNAATGEYGETVDGVWHPFVSMMYDEQFDLVEIDGTVQPRSIFVDCGEAIVGDDGDHLVKTRSHNVNYWMRDCTVEGAKPGCISDITVTEENIGKLGAAVYNEKLGTIIAGTLEKTGGGYLRISTHNTYTGGTWLKEGFLIIDCADALGSPDAGATDRLNGAGDGALHAHGGTTLMLNYIDEQGWSIFRNDIRITMPESNVGEKTAIALRDGFMVTNGIGLGEDGTVNAHFVDLNGAITAETGRRAVMTLSALIVPENEHGFRDYTSYTVTNLEGYNGILRLDSHFASPVEGTVDGMYETSPGEFTALRASQTYKLPDGSELTDEQKAQMDVYYDSTKRQVVYTYNGQRVSIESDYVHLDGSTAPEANSGEVDVKTGGEIELRITGSSLGKTEVDLSLNSAYHNAMVLDMRDPSGMVGTTSVYTLGGVSGLSGGAITRGEDGLLHGYNSNVVSAKGVTGEDAYAVLHLNLNEADRVYSGMVGYGYFHSAAADTLGQIYASAPLAMVKEGPRTQTIFSGRLNGLEIKSGSLHFAKDLILCGDFKTADGTQLIIGTTNMNNLPFCGSAQYSVVIQGDGVWAIGSGHTSKYTTDETKVSTTYKWDEYTTAVGKYNIEGDDLARVYATSGTLTAVSDYSLQLSVRFDVDYGKYFTIDTSHYNYDTEILASEGITKEEVNTPHTISLDKFLRGRGEIRLTGGGTVQLQAANEFNSEEEALLVVEQDTTLRLQHDQALATWTENKGYTQASTVNVTGEGSRAILGNLGENADEAYVAAMRFANDGQFIVESADRATQATVSLRQNQGREGVPGLVISGATSSKNIAGDPATLNIEDVHVTAGSDASTAFQGVDGSGNIRNNAQVTIEDSAAGQDATMTDLTLGTLKTKTLPAGVASDQSLVLLKRSASLKLEDVTIAADAAVHGSTEGTTGFLAAGDGHELVEFRATTVEGIVGDNVERQSSLVYTDGSAGSYHYGNGKYEYSESAVQEDAKQVIFRLANFEDCVITGGEGDLTLRLSDADYKTLLLAPGDGLLGVFFEGVAVQTGTSESLLRIVNEESGASVLSQFYVSTAEHAVSGVVGTYGSVFYFEVPEPSTATLSLLALAALVSRRRRK